MPADTASPATAERSVFRLLRRNTVLQYGGSVLPAFANILVLPLIVRAVGYEAYGIWLMVLAFATGATAIDVGLASAVVRTTAESQDRSDEDRAFLYSAFLINGGLAVVMAAVVFGGAALTLRGASSPFSRAVVLLLCVCGGAVACGQQLLQFPVWVLRGSGRFGAATALTSVSALLRFGGSGVLAWKNASLLQIAEWQAAVILASGIVAVLFWRGGGKPTHAQRFSWPAVRNNAEFALSSQTLQLVNAVSREIAPVLILGRLAGPAVLVVYHLGQRLASATYQLYTASGAAIYTAACGVRRDRDALRNVLFAGSRWQFTMAVPISLLLLVCGKGLLRAWLGYVRPEFIVVLDLWTVAIWLSVSSEPAAYILWSMGRVRRLLIASCAGLAVQLVVYAIFATGFGSTTTAAGVVGAVIVTLLIVMSDARAQLQFSVARLLRAAAAPVLLPALLAAAAGYGALRYFDPQGRWTVLAIIAGCAAFFFALEKTQAMLGFRRATTPAD